MKVGGRGRRVGAAVSVAAMLAAVLALVLGSPASRPHAEAGEGTRPGHAAAPPDHLGARLGHPRAGVDRAVPPRRPNIVLVQMDDFSMDLVPALGSAGLMRRRGASYPWSFVVDSLCCVSRASTLTGQYPHQTGVRTNTANGGNGHGPVGGYEAFAAYGNAERSVNVRLQRAGYHTGYVGKYLNQYEWAPGRPVPELPPGWSEWRVLFGTAYDGWDFASTRVRGGRLEVEEHEAPPPDASPQQKDRAYAGTVVHRTALDFIRRHQDDGRPYFLQVAPYAPHGRTSRQGHYPGDPAFPPAMRDRPGHAGPGGSCGPVRCSDLGVDDLPGFADDQADNRPVDDTGRAREQWRPPGAWADPAGVSRTLRDRARMVQSIDRMVRAILRTVDDGTYVVLTSDNGYHLGQHGLGRGKGGPFDSDIRVPLLITGPGVVPGDRAELVTNIDLAPTFEDLAGLRPARYRSGTSLVPTLRRPALSRRDHAFVEHTWAPSLGDDPDQGYAGPTLDAIPSYVAVRSRRGLLVRHDLDHSWEGTDHAWEYYDYTEHPWERTNTYGAPRQAADVARLKAQLGRFDRCRHLRGSDLVPDRCREGAARR